MSDEVRFSDITDLKVEDKNLHVRITKNADQNREDNQRIIDKIDDIQKSINHMTVPIAEMATQVATNTNDLKVIKETQKMHDQLKAMIEVQAEKVNANTQNRITWNKRAWAIIVMMVVELIGLVFALYNGG